MITFVVLLWLVLGALAVASWWTRTRSPLAERVRVHVRDVAISLFPAGPANARRFEKRVLARVRGHNLVLGRRNYLPDVVQVLVAPEDIEDLGDARIVIEKDLVSQIEEMAQERSRPLLARPLVELVTDPGRVAGNPDVRVKFGGSTDQVMLPGETSVVDNPKLVVCFPENATHWLDPNVRSAVGRLDTCSIQIRDPLLSRIHCHFYKKNSDWYVEDNASSNGTCLNGERVRRPAKLKFGDHIRLGRDVELLFVDPSSNEY